MKDKGQALIEFVLVLPILLLILCALIDFGMIFYNKYTLENELDYIIDLYKNENEARITSYAQEKNFKASYVVENNDIIFTITKDIKINTPGLNKVLGNPYKLKISRTIYE